MKPRKKKKIGIDEPGRGKYLYKCMNEGICPDCLKAVSLGPQNTENVFHAVCASCGWQGKFGSLEREFSPEEYPFYSRQ